MGKVKVNNLSRFFHAGVTDDLRQEQKPTIRMKIEDDTRTPHGWGEA
jgi:hypothetical protein